ncbi:MAG: V-type ATP synthase subunit E family protein [Candidatus Thorarchaeota archaeon]
MTGIDSIIELINRKADEKIGEILSQAEETRTRIIDEATKRAAEVERSRIEKMEREARAELTKFEAGLKLKMRQEIVAARDRATSMVLQAALEKAIELIKSDKHNDILLRLATEGVRALGGGEMEIVLPEGHPGLDSRFVGRLRDATGVDGISVAKDTVRTRGGVIVRTKDQHKWVDNTIEARYDRLLGMLRNTAAETLFGNGE